MISIVIPTYNRKELLRKCVESIFTQTYPKEIFEIIVVDDGSNDGTEKMIMELIEKSSIHLRYLKQKNKGPAAARNFGIREAKGDIIAFTDDDCVADKQWLKNIAGVFEGENVGGVEGKVIMTGESTPFTQDIENLNGGRYMTANIAYRKKLLEKINMFDENYPFPVCEDTDLAYRILKINCNIEFCPTAVIFHPAEEITANNYLKKLRYSQSYIRLYDRNPELYNSISKKELAKLYIFTIFFRLFSIKHWRYLVNHPNKMGKFIFVSFLGSVACLSLTIRLITYELKNIIRLKLS